MHAWRRRRSPAAASGQQLAGGGWQDKFYKQGKHQVVLNDEQPQHPRQQTRGRPRLRRSKLRPVLAWLCRTTVQGLLLAALACFLLTSWARPTTWFRSSAFVKAASDALTIPFPSSPLVYESHGASAGNGSAGGGGSGGEGADVPWLAGSVTLPIVLQWGSLLVAALCTAALLPGWRAAQLKPQPQRMAARRAGVLRQMFVRARHAAMSPLPPHRFWSWACGGLNALEVMFLLVWIGIAGTYIYANVDKRMKRLDGKLAHHGSGGGAVAGSAHPEPGAMAGHLSLAALFLTKRVKEIGKAFGESLRGMLPLMFFPVSRSSFLKWLFGSDFSYLIKFHRWMAWGTLAVSCIHGAVYVTQWALAWAEGAGNYREVAWKLTDRNVTGLLALAAALAIGATSFAWVRTHHFRVFINAHVVGFVLFTLFALMHDPNLVNYALPPLLLYGLDRAFRFWQLASNWALVQPCDLTADGSVVTLKLRWTSGARIVPGQTVYLRVPRLSWLQSHPFSVAGVQQGQAVGIGLQPHPFSVAGVHQGQAVGNKLLLHVFTDAAGARCADTDSGTSTFSTVVRAEGLSTPPSDTSCTPQEHVVVTLHVKARGWWSSGLRQLAGAGQPVWVQVEGPYDTSLSPAPAGPVVVMIAGGIGITPLLGLLRHYLAHPSSRPRTTYLLWSCRALCKLRLLGTDLLEAASPLAPINSTHHSTCHLNEEAGDTDHTQLCLLGTDLLEAASPLDLKKDHHQGSDGLKQQMAGVQPQGQMWHPVQTQGQRQAPWATSCPLCSQPAVVPPERGGWLRTSLHFTGDEDEALVWGSYLQCLDGMAATSIDVGWLQQQGQQQGQQQEWQQGQGQGQGQLQGQLPPLPSPAAYPPHVQSGPSLGPQSHVHPGMPLMASNGSKLDPFYQDMARPSAPHFSCSHPSAAPPIWGCNLAHPSAPSPAQSPQQASRLRSSGHVQGSPGATCLLQPHPVAQPALYAACVLLAVGDGFAALLAAAYVDVYRTRTTGDGMYRPWLGALQWLLLAAGITLPPLLLLAATRAATAFAAGAAAARAFRWRHQHQHKRLGSDSEAAAAPAASGAAGAAGAWSGDAAVHIGQCSECRGASTDTVDSVAMAIAPMYKQHRHQARPFPALAQRQDTGGATFTTACYSAEERKRKKEIRPEAWVQETLPGNPPTACYSADRCSSCSRHSADHGVGSSAGSSMGSSLLDWDAEAAQIAQGSECGTGAGFGACGCGAGQGLVGDSQLEAGAKLAVVPASQGSLWLVPAGEAARLQPQGHWGWGGGASSGDQAQLQGQCLGVDGEAARGLEAARLQLQGCRRGGVGGTSGGAQAQLQGGRSGSYDSAGIGGEAAHLQLQGHLGGGVGGTSGGDQAQLQGCRGGGVWAGSGWAQAHSDLQGQWSGSCRKGVATHEGGAAAVPPVTGDHDGPWPFSQAGLAGLGWGEGLPVQRGRPDVAGLLRRVRAAHAGECSEVEVLVGGPPAMWDAVQEACVRVGAEEGPGPALRARRVAHQH